MIYKKGENILSKKLYLSDWGIVGEKTKTNEIFAKIESDFMKNQDIPSVYVKRLWEKYQALPKKNHNNAMNGNIFEAIITTLLLKEGIEPIYTQASLEFVPNIDYDIVIFPKNQEGIVDVSAPIVLSLKTSLRERYKQADLEGIALKEVYKRALSYLITLDEETELVKFKKKVEEKDIRGIDACLNATSEEFDELIKNIKSNDVSVPPEIRAVKEAKIISNGRKDDIKDGIQSN